jgi:uncharacterized protein YbcV (DUF1398 family)
MSIAIENLKSAQQRAMAGRPKVGGFPYLAETLRRAGVTRNIWSLPSCQSLYLTEKGPVVVQGSPLVTGMADVPPFSREIKGARLELILHNPHHTKGDMGSASHYLLSLIHKKTIRCCPL